MSQKTFVRISTQGKQTIAWVNKLPFRSEKITSKEAWNLTQFGASAIYQSAFNAGLKKWEGTWLEYGKGIDPRKLSKNSYGIFISQYGIYSDRMKPHFVPFNKGYKYIDKWAKNKGKYEGKVGVWVRPHPFIQKGYMRMLDRLDIIAEKITRRIVEG